MTRRGPDATSWSRFQDRRFNGYLGVRLPHELDGEVDAFVIAYMSRPEPLDLGRRAAGVLSAYGQRMASVAVRTRAPEPLRRGPSLQTYYRRRNQFGAEGRRRNF